MQIRNVSKSDRFVPELGRVIAADEVVDVPNARANGYLCQPRTWAAESTPTTPKKKS